MKTIKLSEKTRFLYKLVYITNEIKAITNPIFVEYTQ